MTDFDSPWKEALDVYFKPFMAFFFPRAHAEIDWTQKIEMLDKELQQITRESEQGRRVVDKLVRVGRITGQEEWVFIHVEIQSQEEAEFGRRMYGYNSRLFDLYNREVASFAILGDDRATWRPKRFGYGLWGCHVRFRFPVVKLLDFRADVPALEANPNPFAIIVLAHLKTMETRRDAAARFGWKVRLVKGLHERGLDEKDVRQLIRLIDWMMDLPKPLERLYSDEIHAFEEEKKMPYVTTFERFGHEAGLHEGLLQGIELAIKLKFGAAGLSFLPEIRQIADVAVLQTIHESIETAASPAVLREVWTKASEKRDGKE